MSRILAGPWASQALGDIGADVIKLEPVGVGDDTRSWGPPFTERGAQATYFLCANRNKRSVAVNLKAEEGRRVFLDLAAGSDVVLENFPAGKADALGVGYDDVRARRADIIYASLSGFGRDGPYAGRLAYDVMVAGLGGMLGITGEPDGPPCKPGVALTDIISGLYLHGGILAALLHRERTGRGQRVEVSLLEAQVAALANVASAFLEGGRVPKPMGTAHSSIVPYQAFRTRDGGYVVAGALNDRQFAALARALGRPDLSDDPRFTTNAARVANRAALLADLEPLFAARSRADWMSLLAEASVPCAPVNTLPDVFDDPQVRHLSMIDRIDHPTAGPIRLVRSPVSMSDTPPKTRLPPPLLGQHSREILFELGYSSSKIDHLFSHNIVA